MRLGGLVRRLPGATLTGNPRREVRGITHDSRRVQRGWIFAALPGENAHGLDYLDRALEAGAAAVLSDRKRPAGVDVNWVTAASPRPATAIAAWALAGDPQKDLRLLAVTGTNGKSTTAHLISLLLAASKKPTAFIGTLGARFPDGCEEPLDRTTPEATDLAPLLRRAADTGTAAVAMEVSSHALMQDRLAGLRFEVGVWTNLSRDHLDYHGDMESYFAAKRRLFTDHLTDAGRRVLPVDDQWGARLLDEPREGDVSWGLDRGAVCAKEVHSDLEGSSFILRLPDAEVEVKLPLVGVHNLRNALAAAAAAHAIGLGPREIRRGLQKARPLTGRLERIKIDTPFPVFVDYAHTPEGLRSVLQALRRITDRRLIVVFGAGGDRDQGKRGPMGFAVGELADLAVVTSDNPRSEDPEKIAEAVADGARAAGAEPVVVLDRRAAISTAMERADSRSLVLVAGKGHEAYQTIGDRRIPFSDQEVLRDEVGEGILRMSAAELARVVDGKVEGDPDVTILGAEVDSRRLRENDIFVALPGARCDGHEFVSAALNTAAAALVRSDVELPPPPVGRALVGVADPLTAYHELARRECRERQWKVVAVTGSVGKTTTKDFLAHLLAAHRKTGASTGNRNSTLGLPAEVLSQDAEVEVFVAEAGMSKPGELAILGAILRPDVLLYTLIAPVHTEFFPDLEGIVRAKAELIPWLDSSGTLVINAADPNQELFSAETGARVLRFGGIDSDARLEDVEDLGLLGTRFRLVLPDGEAPMSLALPGRHQAENLLAAAAGATALGLGVAEIADAVPTLRPAEHRGRVLTLAEGIALVDDSYNASPVAMRRLLELLSQVPGRRVAVLGEMYELGELAAEAHRRVGEEAAGSCDLLVAVGGAEAALLVAGARSTGFAEESIHLVEDAQEAADLLNRLLQKGDVVLVKGSRGVGLDRTVAALIGEEAA